MFTLRNVKDSTSFVSTLTSEVLYISSSVGLVNEDLVLNREHPIVQAYPELLSYSIESEEMKGMSGYLLGKDIKYSTKLSVESATGTLVHELQHAIQDIDRRAQGSNQYKYSTQIEKMYGGWYHLDACDSVYYCSEYDIQTAEEKEMYRYAIKTRRALMELEEIMKNDRYNHPGFDFYYASVGEIEARTAEIVLKKGVSEWLMNQVWDKHKEEFRNMVKGTSISMINPIKALPYSEKQLKILANTLLERKRIRLASYDKMKEHVVPVEEVNIMEVLEEHYWKRLGDSYREPKSRPRTNYSRKGGL